MRRDEVPVPGEVTRFPIPFGGITNIVEITDQGSFLPALLFMYNGCGEKHQHNIAVDFGNRAIYTSELGARCLLRWSRDVRRN
jgi:hypothetical protein